MVLRVPTGYVFDPADPRSPSDEQWATMTPDERARVEDMLPSEPDVDFLPPPEGDEHWKSATGARMTLESFFQRSGKSIYISGNIAVYYPGERLFSPDLIAVLDVAPHERRTWSVRREGKGLDFALEIHVAGDREKDVKVNVERYARLGIREYFVFDRSRMTLRGHRLLPADPKRPRVYQPVIPQGGRLASEVLGLDLMLEGTTLRFYHTTAPLLDAGERIARLEGAFNEAIKRAEDEAQRAAHEAQRAEDEAQRAEDEAQRAAHEAQRAAHEAQRAEDEAEARRAAEARVAELTSQVQELKDQLARLQGGSRSGD